MKFGLSTSLLLLVLCLSILTGCNKAEAPSVDDYTHVPLPQLVANKTEFSGKKISTEGYILGLEHHPDTKDGEIWLVVLGDKPQTGKLEVNQVIFPDVYNKIRIGEDGFNREIIRRCHEICGVSKNKKDLIKVYGVSTVSQAFHHYSSGVDLLLNAVEVNGVLIDTDFNDHGKIKEKTPSILRKLYKGGGKVAKLIKKGLL